MRKRQADLFFLFAKKIKHLTPLSFFLITLALIQSPDCLASEDVVLPISVGSPKFNWDSLSDDHVKSGGKTTVGSAWSGQPVALAALQKNDIQVVAYYDANQNLVIAARKLSGVAADGVHAQWYHYTLNTKLRLWDNHNFVKMAFDRTGHLHVSGNMHTSSLNYWKTSVPLTAPDLVSKLEQVVSFGYPSEETAITYPNFINGKNNELIFYYRVRLPSHGAWWIFRYDEASKKFIRASAVPLFEWNAADIYSVYPTLRYEADKFHLVYRWRRLGDDGDSNFDIGYASSSDFIQWKNALGAPINLPIVPHSAGTLIEVITESQNLTNTQVLSLNPITKVPFVSYNRDDAAGVLQTFVATVINGTWNIKQLTASTVKLSKFVNYGTSQFRDLSQSKMIVYSHLPSSANGSNNPAGGYYSVDLNTLAASDRSYYLANYEPRCDNSSVSPNTAQSDYMSPPQSSSNGTSIESNGMTVLREDFSGDPLASQHYYIRRETLPAASVRTAADGSPLNPPATPIQVYRTRCDFSGPVIKDYGVLLSLKNAKEVGRDLKIFSDPAQFFVKSARALVSAKFASLDEGILWRFNLDKKACYRVSGYMRAQNTNADSFSVAINQSAPAKFAIGHKGEWGISDLSDGAGTPLRFCLNAGENVVSLMARESSSDFAYLWLFPVP